jgi:flagellar biosynthesis protein
VRKVKDTPDKRRERAVALRYESEKDDAPRVIAKGAGEIARKIVEIAREHGVTIYEEGELAEVLSRLDLNQIIPPEMYQAVAEVLAFVYRLNGRAPSLLTESTGGRQHAE